MFSLIIWFYMKVTETGFFLESWTSSLINWGHDCGEWCSGTTQCGANIEYITSIIPDINLHIHILAAIPKGILCFNNRKYIVFFKVSPNKHFRLSWFSCLIDVCFASATKPGCPRRRMEEIHFRDWDNNHRTHEMKMWDILLDMSYCSINLIVVSSCFDFVFVKICLKVSDGYLYRHRDLCMLWTEERVNDEQLEGRWGSWSLYTWCGVMSSTLLYFKQNVDDSQ